MFAQQQINIPIYYFINNKKTIQKRRCENDIVNFLIFITFIRTPLNQTIHTDLPSKTTTTTTTIKFSLF